MRASDLPAPPTPRLTLTDDDGRVRVVLRRRAPWALVGGVLAVTFVGGAVVWGVQATLTKAGGLATTLHDAGVGPILALTVSGIAIPLVVIALMVLRPGPLEVAELADDGVHLAQAGGERAWVAWSELGEVTTAEEGVRVARSSGDPVVVSARLDDGERRWLASVLTRGGRDA
jgi:hypothetical protein